MKKTLIKNGTVVTATDTFESDILICGEQIEALGKNLSESASQTIDATGCYVFPGGIDAHTHLDLPFMGTSSSDDFESGTLAALHGGTTSIIDFAFQSHGKSLKEGLGIWHEKAKNKAVGDYAFHMAVTDFNESVRSEIKDFINNEGVTSFKTFMAYKGALMIDDRQMIGLMNEVKKHGGLVTVHAENGDLADSLVQENRSLGNMAVTS
jgi:dihydropyrimidinase